MTSDIVAPPTGKFVDAIFAFPIRVYYEDTDLGGIVYHSNYLNFMERGRTEYMRALDLPLRQLHDETGGQFVARSADIDWIDTASLGDDLIVETAVIAAKGAAMVMRQRVRCGNRVLARADVKIAWLGPDMRPTRLPALIMAQLEPKLAADDCLPLRIKD